MSYNTYFRCTECDGFVATGHDGFFPPSNPDICTCDCRMYPLRTDGCRYSTDAAVLMSKKDSDAAEIEKGEVTDPPCCTKTDRDLCSECYVNRNNSIYKALASGSDVAELIHSPDPIKPSEFAASLRRLAAMKPVVEEEAKEIVWTQTPSKQEVLEDSAKPILAHPCPMCLRLRTTVANECECGVGKEEPVAIYTLEEAEVIVKDASQREKIANTQVQRCATCGCFGSPTCTPCPEEIQCKCDGAFKEDPIRPGYTIKAATLVYHYDPKMSVEWPKAKADGFPTAQHAKRLHWQHIQKRVDEIIVDLRSKLFEASVQAKGEAVVSSKDTDHKRVWSTVIEFMKSKGYTYYSEAGAYHFCF